MRSGLWLFLMTWTTWMAWTAAAGGSAVRAGEGGGDTPQTFTPDVRGFIRDWLVAGPFPSYQVDGAGQGFKTDFFAGRGGEANLRPWPGLADETVFKADAGKLVAGVGSTNEWGFREDRTFGYAWTPLHHAGDDPVISLDRRFGEIDEHHVAYAVCYLASPAERDVIFRVGSDDDHKLFLNGRLVGRANSSQAAKPDDFLHPARLRRGLNVVVMKVVDRLHGFAYCVALSDTKNQPLRDLEVFVEPPARRLAGRLGVAGTVDAWDRGFFAVFASDAEVRFGGKNGVTVRCASGTPGRVAARLEALRDGAVSKRFERTLSWDARAAAEWSQALDLAPGRYQLRLRLFPETAGDAGEPLAVLEREWMIEDGDGLAARIGAVEREMAALRENAAEAEARLVELRQQGEHLRRRNAEATRALAEAYAGQRAATIRSAGDGARSTDLPVADAAGVLRRRTALNGEDWEITRLDDRGRLPERPAWSGTFLPRRQTDEYWRANVYPLVNVDPGNVYGAVKSHPGYEDYVFDESVLWRRFAARRRIDLTAEEAAGSHTLVCEAVSGHLEVYVNGTREGEYRGSVGEVRIPLTALKAGANELRFHFRRSERANRDYDFSDYGIHGDLILESAAGPVQVADVWVRPNWRQALLAAHTEVANRSDAPVAVRLEQYAVLDGRKVYALPAAASAVAPRSTTTLETTGLWADPKCWGIGGVYGEPTLYDLVTDLYVDGQLADRHAQRFGFREFWIAGTEFFLNGHPILLQGDLSLRNAAIPKLADLVLSLERADNINTIRTHDGDYDHPEFYRACDRRGMLAFAQMYAVLHPKDRRTRANYVPLEEWLFTDLHRHNLANYERWFRTIRNSPSVVILSTDNEIFTQAWDTAEQQAFNLRNDRLGALYGQFVKRLAPDHVVTRNGDVGTWGWPGKWSESPPADVANYHYPEFNVNECVRNWQTRYGGRPAVFGETLYYSYGAWNDWIGAIPEQVAKKAARVREIGGLYQRLGIPGQIFMGLCSDGFVQYDETGKGNPWGITAAQDAAGAVPGWPGYPWLTVDWPSRSGLGAQVPYIRVQPKTYRLGGRPQFNWFDARHPNHIRNAVNDAYRETMSPMPPLAPAPDAECIVDLGPGGAGRIVWARRKEVPLRRDGVIADKAGRAWFHFDRPGSYVFRDGARERAERLESRASYAETPGFAQVRSVPWAP